jgi:hypothetical protein
MSPFLSLPQAAGLSVHAMLQNYHLLNKLFFLIALGLCGRRLDLSFLLRPSFGTG